MNRLAFLRSLFAAPMAVLGIYKAANKQYRAANKLAPVIYDEMHLHKAKEIQDHAKLIPVRRNGKPFVLRSTNP